MLGNLVDERGGATMSKRFLYPKHSHPHGIERPNPFRIYVCEECHHVFTDAQIQRDFKKEKWGHICGGCARYARCESHLEAYVPDISWHDDLCDDGEEHRYVEGRCSRCGREQ